MYGATGKHASYFDIWHTGCVYFCNVLGENQYFPFEAYPKSGFLLCCRSFFLQLAEAKDANGLLQ